jgi:hypothetical protein
MPAQPKERASLPAARPGGQAPALPSFARAGGEHACSGAQSQISHCPKWQKGQVRHVYRSRSPISVLRSHRFWSFCLVPCSHPVLVRFQSVRVALSFPHGPQAGLAMSSITVQFSPKCQYGYPVLWVVRHGPVIRSACRYMLHNQAQALVRCLRQAAQKRGWHFKVWGQI